MLLLASALLPRAEAQDQPQPKVVTAGTAASSPPGDAAVLFSESADLSKWTTLDGKPNKCTALNGSIMGCRTGAGDIQSKETFRDAQIHVEFNVPLMANQKGQMRGNSGVYLQGCYELQILDSVDNPTYADGSCGAMYGFGAPLVNASKKPGEWQSYDILFRAPKCDAAGKVTEEGRVTVLHNGILIQDNTKLDKKGAGCALANRCDAGPLRLQDHSGFEGAPDTTMMFRNIWLRKLN